MGALPARYMTPGSHIRRSTDQRWTVEVFNVDQNRNAIAGTGHRIVLEGLSNAETTIAAAAVGVNSKQYIDKVSRIRAIKLALDNGAAFLPMNKGQAVDYNNNNKHKQVDPELERLLREEEEIEEHYREGDDSEDLDETLDGGNEDQGQESTPPKVDAPDPAQAAIDAIKALAAGNMTDDRVRELVKETAGIMVEDATKHLSRPKVIQVKVPDKPLVEIGGITHEVLPEVILHLAAGCHVMLVGPAGTGKSTIAEQAAEALSLTFHPMSVDPSMYRDVLFGFQNVHGDYVTTELRTAYETGGLFLLDEIDNGTASVIGGLNQLLASPKGCGFPDGYTKKHETFACVATANTFGNGPDAQYVGRQALDKATLDRFTVVQVPIDESMESNIAHALWDDHAKVTDWISEVRAVRASVDEHGLREVISPRATYNGVNLLRAGLDIKRVRESVLYKGMTSDVRKRIGVK